MKWNPPSKQEWLEKIKTQRKGADPSDLLSQTTLDNINIDTLYTQSHHHPMAFSSLPWIRCQSYRRMNPTELNKDILSDLKGGSSGIWIDMDSSLNDIPNGDGASIWNLEAWDRALQDVYLEAVPLHINGSFGDIFSILASVHERKLSPVMLGLGIDPCGFFARHGLLPASFSRIFSLTQKIYTYTQHEQLNTKIMRIDTSPYHNAGAYPRTELAIMLATAAEYLRGTSLTPQELSTQLVVSIPVERNIPENIAKLRAARLLLQAIFRACNVDHTPYIHAQTSLRMMSIYDPWTNMLRTTHAAFSAALSKADSISVLPYDTRLGSHTALGRRVARNTHNILAEECGLEIGDDVVQGSHLFETQTQTLMNHAWADFQEIEKKGGLISLLKSGALQKQIDKEYKKRKSWISSGKIPIVGTTHFPQKEPRPEIIYPDTTIEEKRIEHYIFSRGEGPTIGGSSIGSYISQLLSGATRFEIDQGLFFRKEIKTTPLPSRPDALPFEELRSLPNISIPLLLLGQERSWTARAQFAEQFLLSGGIEAHRVSFSEYIQNPISNRILVLCGSDKDYGQALSTLHAQGQSSTILVSTKTDEDIWGLMHQHCDRLTLLQCIHAEVS